MNDTLAIKWDDGSESFINNKTLREKCPCANCSGESDVFGNVYKGGDDSLNDRGQKYIINTYINIGHYAIRIIWGDGHNAGIYSFNFLMFAILQFINLFDDLFCSFIISEYFS